MIRTLAGFLLGASLVAAAATAPAQTDPSKVAGDRWQVEANRRPVAMGCHASAMPGEHVMDFAMRGHFRQRMMDGMGPDAMDGYGMGRRGRGGYDSWAGRWLALSDDQLARTKQITDSVRKQHWELRGKMMDEENRLRDLLEEQTPDPKTVGSAYAALSRLHQQMLETHLQACNDIHALLTPEQRKEAEQQRRSEHSFEGNGHGYRRGMAPR